MKTCDLCKMKVKNHYDLREVNKEYVVEDIREICQKCLDEIDKGCDKMDRAYRKMQKKFLKRLIKNLNKKGISC